MAGKMVAPGVTTDEIDKAVHKMIIEAGAYPSPLNYGEQALNAKCAVDWLLLLLAQMVGCRCCWCCCCRCFWCWHSWWGCRCHCRCCCWACCCCWCCFTSSVSCDTVMCAHLLPLQRRSSCSPPPPPPPLPGKFPKSVCTSVNECICHGIPDSRPLRDGDIVNIDVTVFLDVRPAGS